MLGVVVGVFILIVSRRPDMVFHAQFWAEDGTFWYSDTYSHGFAALFYTYGGYFVFLYHFVALLSLQIPFKWAPLFFSLVAICLQLTPIILIASRRFRVLVRSPCLSAILCFLYVAVPNANEVFGNLTNVQWHLGIAAFLVLVITEGKSAKWRVFDAGILIATGLSGPLVIMLLPIGFWVWWRTRTIQHRRNFVTLSVLAVIQLLTIFIFSSDKRIGSHPQISLRYFIEMIDGQVFTGGLLGQQHVNLFYHTTWALVITFLIGLFLIGYAILKGPFWLKLFIIYAGTIFLAMLSSLKSVKGFNVWWGLANPGGGQRYWYILILAWISVLLWLVIAAPNWLVKTLATFLFCLLLLIGIPQSWSMAPPPNLHFQVYANQFESAPKGEIVSIPENPSWQIILQKK